MSSSRLLAVLALVLAVAGHGWAAAATDEVASPGPTQEPTLGPPVSTITGFYQQDILLTEEKVFTDLEALVFEDLYQSYTPYYGPGEGLVDPDDPSSLITTKCEMTGQSLLEASSVVADRFGKRERRRNLRHIGPAAIFDLLHDRVLQDAGEADGGGQDETGREEELDEDAPPKLSWKLRVIFRITWSSRTIVVDDYANDSPNFVNANLRAVTDDMIASGLRTVKSAQAVFKEAKTTPAPPTQAPMMAPAPTDAPMADDETWSALATSSTGIAVALFLFIVAIVTQISCM